MSDCEKKKKKKDIGKKINTYVQMNGDETVFYNVVKVSIARISSSRFDQSMVIGVFYALETVLKYV